MNSSDIPEGFAPDLPKSPIITDPWEPLYSKRTEKAVVLGLRVAKPHTNEQGSWRADCNPCGQRDGLLAAGKSWTAGRRRGWRQSLPYGRFHRPRADRAMAHRGK